MKFLFLLLFLSLQLFSSDEMCINSTSRDWDFTLAMPPIKAEENIQIKANDGITDIKINVLSKDFKSLFDNNMFSSTDILLNGNKKSNENDNPDKICAKTKFLGGCKEWKEDPEYRANILDNYDLGSYLPFLNNGPLLSLMGDISLWSDGITYNLPAMSTDNTSDLGKEFRGVAAIKDFIGSFFFRNTLVLGTYTTSDGIVHENVILNPCGSEVPTLSINDNSTSASESDKTLNFKIDISGEISGDIADSYDNKSYVHYHTQDGTAIAGTDYIAKEGTLTVNKGDTTAYIDITIKGGGNPGKFYVILDNALGASISDENATGTITPHEPEDETIPTDDANAIKAVCGTFADMFQTRETCSGNSGGTVAFTNAGGISGNSKNIIIDNNDNTLNTCQVTALDWVKNQYETCGESGDCVATGIAAESLTINYANTPATATVSANPTSSTSDITLDGTTTLSASEYNTVTTSWHTDTSTTFEITNQLKINNLKMTTGNNFSFTSSNPYSLEIGTLGIENNGAGNTITTDANAKNIKINNLTLKSGTTLTLEATQTIKMDTLSIGYGSTVTLKAQYVNINNFILDGSGNGDANIEIIADYIDIGDLNIHNHSSGATITIKPFTSNKRILFRTNTIEEGSNSTLMLESGNYYINTSITLPGTSDVSSMRAYDANQIINMYINSDLNPGNNPGINSNGNNQNFGTNPAANFLLFINGDLTTGGGGTTINATIYVEGDATFGNPTYIKGAVSAKNISVGQGQFIYDQSLDDAGFGECGGGSSTYVTGPFDAWDTFRDDASAPPSDRNISTKVVDKAFKLSLASLNKDGDGYEVKIGTGDIDVAIYPVNSTTPISNTITFNASTNDHIAETTDITVNSASKDAGVGFKLCATYELNTTTNKTIYYLYNSTACATQTVLNNCDAPTSGTPTWHICHSTDDFAIRPDTFTITSSDNDMPDLLHAAKKYNVNIKAYNYASTTPTQDYNQTSANIEVNSTKWLNTIPKTLNGTTATLPYTGEPTLDDFNISNGVANVNGATGEVVKMAYDDIGLITLKVKDTHWAAVDADDTPQDCSPNGAYICGDKNATFIPDHFSIKNLRITNTDNVGVEGTFTYLKQCDDTNITSFRDMSARIEILISAENEKNITTVNFTSGNGFYENPLSVDFNVSDVLHGDSNHTTISNQLLGFGQNFGVPNGTRILFWNDNNLSKSLRFNFNREVNNGINPFEINASNIARIDVNTTYIGTAPASPVNIGGTKNDGLGNGIVTFMYGRTHAPRQIIEGADGNISIFIEVFCAQTDIFGIDCNKSLLSNGINSNISDDPRWFINTNHTQISYGTIGTVTQKSSNPHVINNPLNTFFLNNGIVTVPLQYDGNSGYPYKATMENNASGWLIYNKYDVNATTNEFDVEFVKPGGDWAGIHETNTTTDSNASNRTNRRIMW